MFQRFKKDLTTHGDGGYHRHAALEYSEVAAWFRAHSITPPPRYVAFLCEIGPGSFFGGALTIYPLTSRTYKSVASELLRLAETTTEPIFAFGYDGTTESCYCFDGQSGEEVVYWFSWEDAVKRKLADNFHDWVEGKPKELFKEQIYAGYKSLLNVDELLDVMKERSAFNVRLVNFDKQLQRPPDNPEDLFPRYNRLVLEITKYRHVRISVLTVVVARLGSKIGASNIEYATLPVSDIPINVPTIHECYVFDPFNVRFDDISVKFNPIIDLGSKMRVKFKELSGLILL